MNARGRIVFLIVLAIVLFLGAIFSTVIYENSAEGIAYLVGEFAAWAIVASLLSWRLWRRSTYKAATIVLVVGVLGLALGNGRKLLDSLEFREGRAALADARDPSQIDKVLEKHPSNTFLKLMAEAVKAGTETVRLTQKISDEIEPPALAKEINFATASRAELEGYLRDLKTAEANLMTATSQYIALFKDERKKVETFAQSLHVANNTTRNLLSGIDNRHARNAAFNSKMFSARAELYRALGNTVAIMIEQFGNYKVAKNGQIVFPTQLITDRYNVAANDVNTAAKRVAELENERKELEQRQQEGWKRLISGQ